MRCDFGVWTVFASEFNTIKENKVPGILLVVTQDSSSLQDAEASAVCSYFRSDSNRSWDVVREAIQVAQDRSSVQKSYAVAKLVTLVQLRCNEAFGKPPWLRGNATSNCFPLTGSESSV